MTTTIDHPTDAGVVHRLGDLRDSAGDLIEPLGIAPLPDKPLLLTQPASTPFDWVVLRLATDPLFKRGELDIPRQQRRRLRELNGRGVVFDELLIAHEVPKKAIASPETLDDPIALDRVLRPPGLEPDRASGRALRGFLDLAVRGSVALAAGAAVVAVGGVAVASATLAAADPVLIGAVTADGGTAGGTPAALFVLARW